MLSGYQRSKQKSQKTAVVGGVAAGNGDGRSDDVEDNLEKEIMSLNGTESSDEKSSPVNINRHNLTYTVLRDEYSIIEENDSSSNNSIITMNTNGWNPDEAFSESMQIDQSVDRLSSSVSSSSSSSSSSSYLCALVREMIASYPNEEQLAGMIAENYLNYIAEILKEEPSQAAQTAQEQAQTQVQAQNANMNNDSVILLESTGVQTSFVFEQKAAEEAEEKYNNEHMQQK